MKKLTALIIVTVLSLSALTGCGQSKAPEAAAEPETVEATEEATSSDEPMTGMANPWRDITEEEAKAACIRLFKAPDEATNVRWSIMEEGADKETGFPGPLVQLDFDIVDTYSTLSFTARAKQTTDENEDISGMYYDWTVTDDATLANWGGGNMKGKCYRYLGDTETVDLITWFDVEIGIAYSLTTSAEDLDGFDIQAYAEAMYNPDNEPFTGDDSISLYAHVSDDALLDEVYGSVEREFKTFFDEADVSIPVVFIVDKDESDPDDVKVWGDFWIYNYNLEGETLMCESGGAFPGCMHLKKNGDFYEFFAMDQVEDGGNFIKSAKRIFGNNYDKFMEIESDQDAREAERKKIIKEYVDMFGYNITAYQDTGWDPVPLD